MKMKKILLGCIIAILSISLGENAFAAEGDGTIKVRVSTFIPGAGCEEKKDNKETNCWKNPEKCFYECKVEPGFSQVSKMLGRFIKYATFLAGLGGVLFLVISGIQYSMSGTSGETDGAKKHIQQVVVGLVILLLSWYILYAIAPWVFIG
jgi:Type IV secretion system pilin